MTASWRNIVASTNDAAELVRRELCAYGITVGTLAGKTIKNEATVRSIAGEISSGSDLDSRLYFTMGSLGSSEASDSRKR